MRSATSARLHSVRYYVRAQRENQVSPASDEATVNLGMSAAA